MEWSTQFIRKTFKYSGWFVIRAKAELVVAYASFECRGCTKMKELEVELEQLRQWWEGSRWVVPVVPVGGTVDDNVGEDDERDVRKSDGSEGDRREGVRREDNGSARVSQETGGKG